MIRSNGGESYRHSKLPTEVLQLFQSVKGGFKSKISLKHEEIGGARGNTFSSFC